MKRFFHYIDPSVPLEERLIRAFEKYGVEHDRRGNVMAFLAPLKLKDSATYEHSIRVGILSAKIAEFMHLDPKATLYAGLLHDTGKALVPLSTLQRTEGWSAADQANIEPHVIDGYRLLRGMFDFSAEIVLWHHRFQPNCYPKEIPDHLHDYSQGTKVLIPFFGWLLAIADAFDALHRPNDKHGPNGLNGEEIKKKMLMYNPDMKALIDELFKAGILTEKIFEEEAALV